MLKLLRTIQQQDPGTLLQTLKEELESGVGESLPLDQATLEGGYCEPKGLEVTVLGIQQNEATLQARIGVFFTEIVANCSCGDEPMEKPAYCQMSLIIDRVSGETTARIIGD